MARTDLNIPALGSKFVDIRDSIPGDSFNWSWVRPLSQVNYLAIHHSASPDTQTPTEIANYHINSNGWAGIGYHFVITKDGVVYYVGDISTARANVANLNEQVLGICLIGNFTAGNVPSTEQIDSAHKLCDFLINNYPSLSNIQSWDAVKGHKELPGQATVCPGDNWPSWEAAVISSNESLEGSTSGTVSFNPPSVTENPLDRNSQISDLYRSILGRDPDIGGLQTYITSPQSITEIEKAMIDSQEHKNLLRLAKEAPSLQGQVAGLQETVNHQKTQIDSLQMSMASINGQIISLKETLHQREDEIANLRSQSNSPIPQPVISIPEVIPVANISSSIITPQPTKATVDKTITILQALFNLYKFLFWPRSNK